MTAPESTSLSPIKRALAEIRELKERLARAEAPGREPIAVVGIGCRFPGHATDPASFWALLERGVDAIGTVPPDRWDADRLYHPDPDHPGTMTTRSGGFLDGVDQFDAAFFGIAPAEAATMDPQQRLLLEVAWEALERSGVAPGSLRGSATGVFVGVGNNDYGRMLFADRDHLDAHAGSGGSLAVIPGRLSYLLGLEGPSLAVDTACSASLVAIHLACQSLRSGESELALAGGVNLILSPETHIAFSRARMMAPDGRCKTFDAAADGYGRGEGCGVVVLRRLSDALRRGDRVLAVIRGSAVNQDGRSGGLTVPNGPAQEAVIRSALAAGGIETHGVDYVEAHGTGTPLGDPIELRALAATYGTGRPASRPLYVGSIKTNLGHLEAAAGIAGFIKAVLTVERGVIPPHLHFHTPNPHVGWNTLPLSVPTTPLPWPEIGDRPRRAGVSSFGFSGTNAHLVVEEAPRQIDTPIEPGPGMVLVGSARTAAGLGTIAASYADSIEQHPGEVGRVAAASAMARTHFEHRFAIPVRDAAQTIRDLRLVAEGQAPDSGALGVVTPGELQSVAFLFPGQGPQYLGMGAELYRTSPVFRAAVEEVARLAGPVGPVILAAMSETGDVDLDQTAAAQPALFAFQYAMSVLWRSWGVEPTAVLGHSVGEFTAAVVAGVLSLQDGIRLVTARGRLMQTLPPGGAMASVLASETVVRDALRAAPEVELAAVNGPAQVAISGPAGAVDAVCAALTAQGVKCKRLAVSHASHSALITPMLEPFEREASSANVRRPAIRVASTVTGGLAGPEFGTASYWRRQLREPVRFADAVATLSGIGIRHWLEMGPHPVLLGLMAQAGAPAESTLVPSARRGEPAWPILAEGLAALHVRGVPIRWEERYRGVSAPRIDLSTYPFQRRRYWAVSQAAAPQAVEPRRRWDAAVAAARRQGEQAPLGYGIYQVNEMWSALELLTLAHAQTALSHLGAFDGLAGNASRTVEQVLERTGILPLYRHLVRRWLDGLTQQGVLLRDGDRYRPRSGALAPADVEHAWETAERSLEGEPALRAYLRNCSRLLESVLTGKMSPLETLFPGGSAELAERLYADTGAMRYVNLVAAAAAEACAVRQWDRPLRILELGAGTGGTTVAVLPRLDPERTEYWFTDVSSLFLDRAAERFGGFGGLRTALLDLEKDPEAQGFGAGTFDAVIATNAVHAVKDLGAALERIVALLAPGGLLILVESTAHLAWFDMSTGLIEGWQHFGDELRGDNPLLPATAWEAVLRRAGFGETVVVPESGTPAAHGGQQVLLALKPGQGVAATAVAPETRSAAAPATLSRAPVAGMIETLRAAPIEEREQTLVDLVRREVVRVLRLDEGSAPSRQHRLMDLGFDSLLAVQLRDRLGKGFDLADPLPVTLLFDYPTIEAIARYLLERLQLAPAPGEPSTPNLEATRPNEDEARLANLSDEEVTALLLERLGRIE